MFGRLKSLLLSCPHCGYKQEESQVARSTFCRKRECGAHYRIEDGQPVQETPPAAYPFPLRDQLGEKAEGSKADRESQPRKEREQLPRQKQLELFSGKMPGDSGCAERSSRSSRSPIPQAASTTEDHPAIARLARLLPEVPRAGHRHVHCLECGFPQSIPEQTCSTMCLRCSASIPLENHELHTMRHRRIRTRGDVHIHPGGGLSGVSIHCNNLTIEETFTGSNIDCDGDLTISRNGTVTGSVRCRRLIVQEGAEVGFLHPVRAQEVFIDGIVRGEIACARTLHLEEQSILEGNLQARSLSISEGARHCGRLSLPKTEEPYAKFRESTGTSAHGQAPSASMPDSSSRGQVTPGLRPGTTPRDLPED